MYDFLNGARVPQRLIVGASLIMLTACGETGPLAFLQRQNASQPDTFPSAPAQLVEQDVESPDVFQAIEMGLWDGRPSLGGTWVAHPDVTEPERVIIRNTTNGQSVIGALFRREVENPGPRVQVSSDAAVALGMLAGQPAALSVTALRREQVAEPSGDTTTQTDISPDPL